MCKINLIVWIIWHVVSRCLSFTWWEVGALSVCPFPVGSILSQVCVHPKGLTHWYVNHHSEMREEKQKSSPRAKPSHYSTHQACCLTQLSQLPPSQIPDRFLSSLECAVMSLTHSSDILPWKYSYVHVVWKALFFYFVKFQSEGTSPIVITFKRKIFQGMQCMVWAANSPHTGLVRTVSTGHKGKMKKCGV